MTMPIEKEMRPQFTPDEAWIDAFATQNTSELRELAKRYAARRLRRVGASGTPADELDVRALVQDAFTDTLFGEVVWDPVKKSLEQHVLDTLKYRTRDVRKRARRFKHERIDVFAEDSATMADVESSLRCGQEMPSTDELLFAEQVIARLRELAAHDEHVSRLIDAIAEGATEPADIAAVGKLTAKQYRNARERLDRLVKNLDNELCKRLRS
ncbi:MAG TPA: hypothetical protein VGG74_01490 [Kofleriaceae bacterium]